MLIGIDASRANRERKSGTEYYSYYLIRNLSKLDSKNKYILYSDKPLKGGLLDLTTSDCDCVSKEEIKYDSRGYQIIKSPHNNFKAKILHWPFSFFWTLGRLSLEMLFNKPDVLFVPAHTLPLVLPKKSINTIHDIAFKRDKKLYVDHFMGSGKSIKNMINFFTKLITLGKYNSTPLDYLDWSTEFALRKAKKIITISEFTKNEILDIYKIKPEKIKVIYNGYNSDVYKKINNKEEIKNILHKYGIIYPYILYIGRLEKKKNTPALIEAFAMVKEKNREMREKLVLLGYGSLGYDEVKYLIEEYNLEEEVIMPGWVRESDVPFLYNGARGFIFPSKQEGFGIPILQAMACGTPIAASDIAPLREVAQDAALFFDPNDICAIAKGIETIIQDENLKEGLIVKGKNRVINFSWQKCAQETLDVINDL